ncbi:MAG: UDP-3-O-[3-hydroxymyristoyl] N-acetylglucosamine deacetylase [Planctomycetes bacterium]|nr:UDP-3-O-[3-hydroxymyristoyl] N-acetylglucosamine deacetylase [Planctomycetota bacterium]
MKQTTLKSAVSLKGTSLHEGHEVTLTLKPGAANEGYKLVRTDKAGATIRVHPDNIAEAQRRTLLRENNVEVHTVEHVLSALYGCGVDNAIIELSAAEPPAGDGSAKAFTDMIDQSGVAELAAEAVVFTPTAPLAFSEGKATLSCIPGGDAKTLAVEYVLDYGVPHLPLMRCGYAITPDVYRKEVGPARTFCLEEEAKALQAMGFGKGANTKNTLVVGKTGVLENTLQFKDEFCRHKLLDVVGDLAVTGLRLNAQLTALRSGHSLNQKMAKAIRAQYDAAKTKPSGVGALDIQGVLKVAPHRYPFLMVDRVLECEGTHVVGIKNVTYNEPCFAGHFPGRPIFPGVLQIEALAQVGGLLVLRKPEHAGKLAFFTSVDEVKFRRLVVPGDQLMLEAELLRDRRGFAEIKARATVDGELCCEGLLKFMVVDEKSQTK